MSWQRVAVGIILLSVAAPAFAQNVIQGERGATVEPTSLTADQVAALVNRAADFGKPAKSPEARRVADKLNAHVVAMLDNWPLRPFQNTVGISGYETYFAHPDELFHALSIALPHLQEKVHDRTLGFLAVMAKKHPPYAAAGLPTEGKPRESYRVPEELRQRPKNSNTGTFGVYAWWEYCHYAGRPADAREHWPQVRQRMQPLLEQPYAFDIKKRDYRGDEAERLNGDLAGLIGTVRLARLCEDPAIEKQALAQAGKLLELRVNLERVNPRIYEQTNSATGSLHIGKLARFCSLTPEVGQAVATLTDGTGKAHLQAFRAPRNGWYLAFGERMIGGENYVNPPHFSRATFSGAALVEQIPAGQLLQWVDVPWCQGDLYLIEKCTLALWADAGRPWQPLD